MAFGNYSKEEMGEKRRLAEIEKKTLFDDFNRENDDQMKSHFQNVPLPQKKAWIESLSGKLSTKKAIRLKCMECSGWSLDEAKRCDIKACVLNAYRP